MSNAPSLRPINFAASTRHDQRSVAALRAAVNNASRLGNGSALTNESKVKIQIRILLLSILLGSVALSAKRPPNIVLILSDDQAQYYATCEWFDETCGELLRYLDVMEVSKNTLVIYICDNGWAATSTNANDPKQKL